MATEPTARSQGVPPELLEQLRPRLRRVLRARRIPAEDAEDLIQNALMALVDDWDRVRDPEAWTVGTVRKLCLMYWRSRSRCLYDAVEPPTLEWLAGGERAPQEHRELEHDLGTMMARLPDRYRTVLRLRYGLGCKTTEVAERTGYRTSSIGKITSRSLEALGREMAHGGYRASV